MIVRTKRTRHFYVVNNDLLENPDLSFAAKGLLIYLLSRPDHWRVSYRHLAGVGRDGAHVTRKLLRGSKPPATWCARARAKASRSLRG